MLSVVDVNMLSPKIYRMCGSLQQWSPGLAFDFIFVNGFEIQLKHLWLWQANLVVT